MIRISTNRLIIRNFNPDDWHGLQEIIIDKEASKYAYTDHPFPTSEPEVKGVTDWFSQSDSFLAVGEKSGGKLIGYIAINCEKEHEYNLGYCFLSAFQNKGYATEGCIAVINYAFKDLNAQKLTSGTALINQPSCGLLTRLGFQKTGESVTSFRKDNEGKPLEFTGAFFELSRENWKRANLAI